MSPSHQQDHRGTVRVSSNPDIHVSYRSTHPLPIPPTTPVILLSNSLAATTVLWDAFAAEFAPTHAVLRYDARFHGDSPLLPRDYYDYEYYAADPHTVEDLASDAAAVLSHAGVARARAFVGLSIGAATGVVLAATRPEVADFFIIAGTKASKGPGDDAAWDARVKAMREEGGREAQARGSVERWFGQAWIEENQGLARGVEEMARAQSAEGFVAGVEALRGMDLWKYADEIREKGDGGRVVFVAGERDAEVVREETRVLAERAGSECVMVEGAGHIVNVEQPGRFHEIVRRVLG